MRHGTLLLNRMGRSWNVPSPGARTRSFANVETEIESTLTSMVVSSARLLNLVRAVSKIHSAPFGVVWNLFVLIRMSWLNKCS
jgi:hypothetical protein